eukprot:112776_1
MEEALRSIYGAMLRNQRPTLDSKLTGDCQHILIKYFHPTLGFTKIHKGFCDVIKINPSLIDFHLFIRGYAPHIVSTVHWNFSSQQTLFTKTKATSFESKQ